MLIHWAWLLKTSSFISELLCGLRVANKYKLGNILKCNVASVSRENTCFDFWGSYAQINKNTENLVLWNLNTMRCPVLIQEIPPECTLQLVFCTTALTRVFGGFSYTGYRIHFFFFFFKDEVLLEFIFIHNSIEALEFKTVHLSGISFGKRSVKSVLKQCYIKKIQQ